MFYNEFAILELRLTICEPHVQKFVLVESEMNHMGTPKPLYFEENKERFKKWLPMIDHIIVRADEMPKGDCPWEREKYQRDCIRRGLKDVEPWKIVMISDVDEIPDLSKIKYENLPHMVNSIHMYMFEYSLNYMFTGEPWIGTVITTCEFIIRDGPNFFRDNRWKFPIMMEAGWHLSSMGDGKHVFNKLHTYAHGRDESRRGETVEKFENYIENGIHIDGKTELLPTPPHVKLPGSVELLVKLGLIINKKH
jgi:beta-1,4-mannosyl-glycoprotein beta-1,4-N-acetylglucosaminyltransferase